MNSRLTNVVLADDHAKVRAGIRNLIENAPDIVVVGEASDGIEALSLVEELSPDVLLLDIEMPFLNGTEVAARLKERGSPVRILALSAHDDRHYILGMLDNGAAGYLTKEEVPDVLVTAIRGIARGEQGWFSTRVAKKLSSSREGLERMRFTDRELQVLRLVVNKKTNKDISEQQGINERTVERHIEMLCTKLRAGSRVELIALAIAENLV